MPLLPEDLLTEVFYQGLNQQKNLFDFLDYIKKFILISKDHLALLANSIVIENIKRQLATIEVTQEELDKKIAECFKNKNATILDILLSHPLADKNLLIAEEPFGIPIDFKIKDERGFKLQKFTFVRAHQVDGYMEKRREHFSSFSFYYSYDDGMKGDNRLNPLLHHAIKAGWQEGVDVLLRHNIDQATCQWQIVDAVFKNTGLPVLHLAVVKKDIALILKLIQSGIDVHMRDAKGRNALHIAVMLGDKEVIRALLEQQVDRNAEDQKGRTPLDYVTMTSHIELVNWLLENGFKHRKASFYSCIGQGHMDMVRKLYSSELASEGSHIGSIKQHLTNFLKDTYDSSHEECYDGILTREEIQSEARKIRAWHSILYVLELCDVVQSSAEKDEVIYTALFTFIKQGEFDKAQALLASQNISQVLLYPKFSLLLTELTEICKAGSLYFDECEEKLNDFFYPSKSQALLGADTSIPEWIKKIYSSHILAYPKSPVSLDELDELSGTIECKKKSNISESQALLDAHTSIPSLIKVIYRPNLQFAFEAPFLTDVPEEKKRQQLVISEIEKLYRIPKEVAEAIFKFEVHKWNEQFKEPPLALKRQLFLYSKEEEISRIEGESAELIAKLLYQKLIALDKKVGLFGGEKVKLDNGETIVVPKHVSEMLKDYPAQSQKPTAYDFKRFLIKCITIAKESPLKSGDHFFHRCVDETASLYEEIKRIKIPPHIKRRDIEALMRSSQQCRVGY